MRRAPGVGAGANATAQAFRRYLVGDPFTTAPTQWGVVQALHGGFSSTLAAAASAGATSLSITAAPIVNDLLLVGTLANTDQVVRVTAVNGSGPYTVNIVPELPSSQASGASVVSANTLDVYLDGTQTYAQNVYLTPGVRYLDSYSPTAGDVVLVLRGEGPSTSDRVVVGKLA